MSRQDRKCPQMSDVPDPSTPAPKGTGTLQLVVSLINNGDLDGAAVAARSLGDSDNCREAWALIASANANLQRFGAALGALEKALQFAPGSRPLRLQRALLLERDGRA